MSEKTRRKKDGGRADKSNAQQREANSDPARKAELSDNAEDKTEMTDEQRAAQSQQTKKAMGER